MAPDGHYTVRVSCTDACGSMAALSGSVTVDTTRPVVSGVGDGPDPFSPRTGQTTTIRFTISETAYATLRFYNTNGAAIRTLLSGALRMSGTNAVVWDGRSQDGAVVPAGGYTYALWVWDAAGNAALSPYPVIGTVTVQ